MPPLTATPARRTRAKSSTPQEPAPQTVALIDALDRVREEVRCLAIMARNLRADVSSLKPSYAHAAVTTLYSDAVDVLNAVRVAVETARQARGDAEGGFAEPEPAYAPSQIPSAGRGSRS